MARGPRLEGFGTRLRAAIMLAATTTERIPDVKLDVARELNVSVRTLDRTILGHRHPNDWEIERLSELLEVPEWFLRSGFAGAAEGARDDVTAGLRVALVQALTTPEVREALRSALGELARADTAGRLRELERGERA